MDRPTTLSPPGLSPLPARSRVALAVAWALCASGLGADSLRVTNPPPGRLAYWRFNQPDWANETGVRPLVATNVQTAPGADGSAAAFVTTNRPAVLRYPVAPPGQAAQVGLPRGTIRFLYKPRWSTQGPYQVPLGSWGRGPRRWARLFELGSLNASLPSPRLALSVDPGGNAIALVSWDSAGHPATNFLGALDWPYLSSPDRPQPDSQWHEVRVAYTPTNSVIAIDGQVLPNRFGASPTGSGVNLAAPAPPSDWVFSPGSSLNGDLTAEGWIDELETFDRAIPLFWEYARLEPVFLSASTQTDPPRVTLHRYAFRAKPVDVVRRPMGSGPWTRVATNFTGMTLVDSAPGLEAGRAYEYVLGDQSIVVGLDRAAPDTRGRVLLLVDRTLAGRLQTELRQFEADLTGDGWTVVRQEAPRHDDQAWNRAAVNNRYKADLAEVRSRIQAEYRADPAATRAVVLLGHVTIPYSGIAAEDGHMDHSGAWPADAYYGDVDGDWSDRVVNNASTVSHPRLRNVPGDGKFDAATFNEHIVSPGSEPTNPLELAVGRIDFAGLPAFGSNAEIELLRRYLAKNHRYRFAALTFAPRILLANGFGYEQEPEAASLFANAIAISSRTFGDYASSILAADPFASATPPSLWGIQGGYGAFDALHNSAGLNRAWGLARRTVDELARGTLEPPVAFHLVKGSYFGDWNLGDNNFLRALIATPNYGLAALWTRDTVWRLEAFAAGDTLGDAVVRTGRGNRSVRTTCLIGDPTLRGLVTPPPTNLRAQRGRNGVTLRWNASPQPSQGYVVLRSFGGSTGSFARLGQTGDTIYLDDAPSSGRLVYQVRTLQRVTTGSGSFMNSSQGAFASVE